MDTLKLVVSNAKELDLKRADLQVCPVHEISWSAIQQCRLCAYAPSVGFVSRWRQKLKSLHLNIFGTVGCASRVEVDDPNSSRSKDSDLDLNCNDGFGDSENQVQHPSFPYVSFIVKETRATDSHLCEGGGLNAISVLASILPWLLSSLIFPCHSKL